MITSGFASTSSFNGTTPSHIFRSLSDSTFSTWPLADIIKTEINWVVGTTLGAFCYGTLLSLGLRCLRALYSLPPQRGFPNQRMLLMLHITSLIILNGVFQVNAIRENVVEIFYTRPEALTYFYMDKWNLSVVIAFAFTDGLLVWRCYMVQKVLLRGRKVLWHNLFWAFPFCLWLLIVSVGIYSILVSDSDALLSGPADSFSLSLFSTCVMGNILLNLFATSYISIRLLIHRRSLMNSFEDQSTLPKYHFRIISILLEAAVINLPVSVVTMVCMPLVGGWGHLFWQVIVPAQSYSSALVIYRVARGRAVGSESTNTKTTESVNLDTVGESVSDPEYL